MCKTDSCKARAKYVKADSSSTSSILHPGDMRCASVPRHALGHGQINAYTCRNTAPAPGDRHFWAGGDTCVDGTRVFRKVNECVSHWYPSSCLLPVARVCRGDRVCKALYLCARRCTWRVPLGTTPSAHPPWHVPTMVCAGGCTGGSAVRG